MKSERSATAAPCAVAPGPKAISLIPALNREVGYLMIGCSQRLHNRCSFRSPPNTKRTSVVSSNPETPVDPRVLEQKRQQINKLIEEVAKLSDSQLSPQEYYAE